MKKNQIKFFLFPFVLTLVLCSCRKEKTSWSSNWAAPLINDTLTLKNLVNDSTLSVNSNNFYEVDLTRTIANFKLPDIVKIPDTIINHDYHLSSGSINVTPGYNIVNQIEEHELEMQGVELKKIRVKEGKIILTVKNPLPTIVNFTVKLPGVTLNGVDFTENYSVAAANGASPGVQSSELDISGFWVDLQGENGNSFNVFQSQMIIQTDPNGPTVTLSASHIFKIEANFKGIKMDYARGYFGNKLLTDTITTTLDFLNIVESGNADLPETYLKFDISNGMKLNANAKITHVSNTNKSGNTVNLTSSNINSNILLNGATGSWGNISNANHTIEFTPLNSNLEQYLENLGSQHTIAYQIQLNPFGNTSGGWDEIFPDSKLQVKVHAELPLAIGADDLTLIDTFDIDLSNDGKNVDFESGMFVLDVTNAFPLEGELTLFLLDQNNQLMHTIYASDKIKSSVYGTAGNDGIMKLKSNLNIPFSEAVLNDLNLIKKVALKVKLNSPNAISNISEQVNIPANAFLSTKLKANLKIKTSL